MECVAGVQKADGHLIRGLSSIRGLSGSSHSANELGTTSSKLRRIRTVVDVVASPVLLHKSHTRRPVVAKVRRMWPQSRRRMSLIVVIMPPIVVIMPPIVVIVPPLVLNIIAHSEHARRCRLRSRRHALVLLRRRPGT